MRVVSVREVWERTGARGKFLWLLLLPVSLFYSVAVQLRNSLYTLGWVKSARLPRPVISIGNLTVGGTGKTPTCLWLAEELKSHGSRKKKVVKNGLAVKSRLGHKKLNCEAGINS